MLELVLMLLREIEKLAKYRGEFDEKFFKNHVDPIYAKLESVVPDYRRMFDAAAENLADADTEVEQVISDLRRDRRRFAETRESLRSAAAAVRQHRFASQDVQDFCEYSLAVVTRDPYADDDEIYDVDYERYGDTEANALIGRLESLKHKAEFEDVAREAFVKEVRDVLWSLNDSWKKALHAYNKLRVTCLNAV